MNFIPGLFQTESAGQHGNEAQLLGESWHVGLTACRDRALTRGGGNRGRGEVMCRSTRRFSGSAPSGLYCSLCLNKYLTQV